MDRCLPYQSTLRLLDHSLVIQTRGAQYERQGMQRDTDRLVAQIETFKQDRPVVQKRRRVSKTEAASPSWTNSLL
jgi:hypothetical protein